ncbi:pyridoxal phosphate-dependent transferase [Dichotomocladium elegans]|nr:pyridoxal phosphate-dependent transferase [Dichotomocladium elegans]
MTAFGKSLRSEFLLEPDYIPLNHGSYGTIPKSVTAAMREFQDKSERQPDRWHRIEVKPLLRRSRELIAELIHAEDPADIALTQNATTGICTVLRSFPFEQGDKVLCYSVAYGTVALCLQYLQDIGRIEIVKIDLDYPQEDDEILNLTREAIAREKAKDAGRNRIRMAVYDALVAQPGVRFPFEKMTQLMREQGILSLVDGSHTAGQIPVNMTELDPDFYITNLHKWLYTPRGSSILYVPKRNQRFLHPLSISPGYRNSNDPDFSFENEFGVPGTVDLSPLLCVEAALQFRSKIGGEEAIMDYCHQLARKGGALVAEILGTSVLENASKTLTAAMVNVEIPLVESIYGDDNAKTVAEFHSKLMLEHNCMAPLYKHNGKWAVRLSAQVYNDLDDFSRGALAIKKVCRQLQKQ